MPKVFCIIPARNEATRVVKVITTALQCSLIEGEVWVVDNCSTDGTAISALSAGAKVMRCDVLGKGNAVAYAIRQLAHNDDIILLLDADLKGLRLDHIERLLRPVVSGRYVQSGGVCDDSSWNRWYWRWHIGLTGQRAFRASLLWEIYELDYHGWALEVALNSICRWSPKRRKRQIAKVYLDGLRDTPKLEKYPSMAQASAARREVFAEWLKGLIRFNLAVRYKHWLI